MRLESFALSGALVVLCASQYALGECKSWLNDVGNSASECSTSCDVWDIEKVLDCNGCKVDINEIDWNCPTSRVRVQSRLPDDPGWGDVSSGTTCSNQTGLPYSQLGVTAECGEGGSGSQMEFRMLMCPGYSAGTCNGDDSDKDLVNYSLFTCIGCTP